MFIIDIHYIVPFEELDKHLPAHAEFLDNNYKTNMFIASGRKVPRTGGVILAVADSIEDVQKVVEQDPFHILKLAEHRITEFLTTKHHPDLQSLLG